MKSTLLAMGAVLATGALAQLRSGSGAVDVRKRKDDLRRLIAPGSGATPNERATAQRILAKMQGKEGRGRLGTFQHMEDRVFNGERKRDVVALAAEFVRQANRQLGSPVLVVAAADELGGWDSRGDPSAGYWIDIDMSRWPDEPFGDWFGTLMARYGVEVED